jgi:uncharacterized protein with FMN-binding domain
MRRGPLVVGAAVAGLAGVLGFHTSGGKIALGGNGGGSPPTGGGSTTTTSPKPSTGGTTTPTTPTTPTTTPPPSSTVRSATGAAEQYGYGTLSVKVTVRGNQIVDISMVSLQTAESYSQSLAQQVIPTLRNEVLSAQTASISSVSGATYTSEAYAYSVQAALDKLHVA